VRAVDVIARQRDGQAVSEDELREFIGGIVDGSVADYQAAAWLMAVYLRGMSVEETVALTRVMARSGQVLDLGALASRSVDKHSTGGVGDKVSLVAGPIAAAAGVVVPKMSGRGLGITGGTLDKLESIPGLRVALSDAEILQQAAEVGLVLAGQTADLAPADGKLYALRDVTATIESLPLIVSSILSKKLAGGAPSIVLDVKGGSGAFMPTVEAARTLARSLVGVGTACGRRVVAFVSHMDQPLGWSVGNALEVQEAIDLLRGAAGPSDVRELALTLASEMVLLAGLADSARTARSRAQQAWSTRAALGKLGDLIEAQGGDRRVIDDPERLPRAPVVARVVADRGGTVARLDAGIVGSTLVALGAGRARMEDRVDHRVGVVFDHKVGAAVMRGETLFTLHLAERDQLEYARERILSAYTWSSEQVFPPAVVLERIDATDAIQ
jgi:pyrimidine-nucleoside phosphorylase